MASRNRSLTIEQQKKSFGINKKGNIGLDSIYPFSFTTTAIDAATKAYVVNAVNTQAVNKRSLGPILSARQILAVDDEYLAKRALSNKEDDDSLEAPPSMPVQRYRRALSLPSSTANSSASSSSTRSSWGSVITPSSGRLSSLTAGRSAPSSYGRGSSGGTITSVYMPQSSSSISGKLPVSMSSSPASGVISGSSAPSSASRPSSGAASLSTGLVSLGSSSISSGASLNILSRTQASESTIVPTGISTSNTSSGLQMPSSGLRSFSPSSFGTNSLFSSAFTSQHSGTGQSPSSFSTLSGSGVSSISSLGSSASQSSIGTPSSTFDQIPSSITPNPTLTLLAGQPAATSSANSVSSNVAAASAAVLALRSNPHDDNTKSKAHDSVHHAKDCKTLCFLVKLFCKLTLSSLVRSFVQCWFGKYLW